MLRKTSARLNFHANYENFRAGPGQTMKPQGQAREWREQSSIMLSLY